MWLLLLSEEDATFKLGVNVCKPRHSRRIQVFSNHPYSSTISLFSFGKCLFNKDILIIFAFYFLQTCLTPFLSGIVLTKKIKIPCFPQVTKVTFFLKGQFIQRLWHSYYCLKVRVILLCPLQALCNCHDVG